MVAAATKQQYKFVPVFAVMAETGTNRLRRVLKITFDGFLHFSRADFHFFLKEYSGLYD